MTPGGYEVVMTGSGLTRIFGDEVADWKREQTSNPAARAMRMRAAA